MFSEPRPALHEFVMHPPGGRVADTQGPLQRQWRQARFCLTDQVDRQKPEGQGQMCALEQSAGDERCLVATGLTGVEHDSLAWESSE